MKGIGKFYRISFSTQLLSPRYNDDTLFTYFLVPLMSGALTGPMILTDYLIHISTCSACESSIALFSQDYLWKHS